MTAYELAKKYYPNLWDENRLNQLVIANILTQDEINEIINSI